MTGGGGVPEWSIGSPSSKGPSMLGLFGGVTSPILPKRGNARGAKGVGIAFEIGSTGNGRNPIFNGRRQPSGSFRRGDFADFAASGHPVVQTFEGRAKRYQSLKPSRPRESAKLG